MGLLQAIFGKAKTGRAKASGSHPQRREATRRELVAMAIRDTVRRSGVPERWLRAETLVGTLPNGRESGMHVRLVLTEWEPRFLQFMVALQRGFQNRLERLDPLARTWMTGVSWKIEPPMGAVCPELPSPDFWQGSLPVPQPGTEKQGKPSAREHLKRLFAANDVVLHRDHAHLDFSPTQPMGIGLDER